MKEWYFRGISDEEVVVASTEAVSQEKALELLAPDYRCMELVPMTAAEVEAWEADEEAYFNRILRG